MSNLENLNILGLNKVYVIQVHAVDSIDIDVMDFAFVSLKEAEEYAAKFEREQHYRLYTSISELIVK